MFPINIAIDSNEYDPMRYPPNGFWTGSTIPMKPMNVYVKLATQLVSDKSDIRRCCRTKCIKGDLETEV